MQWFFKIANSCVDNADNNICRLSPFNGYTGDKESLVGDDRYLLFLYDGLLTFGVDLFAEDELAGLANT